MKSRLVLFALLFASTTDLSAQATAAELSKCAGVSVALLRLRCFDALAKPQFDSTSPSANGMQGATSVGNWLARTESDPMTDQRNATFLLEAASSRGISAPALVLKCTRGELNAYVATRKYLSDNRGVLVRFGADQPLRERWSSSSDKTALFVPGNRAAVEAFIEKLGHYDKVAIQVDPYSEAPMTMLFELAGSDKVGEQVRTVCQVANK